MAAIVCHGFHSYFESQLVESRGHRPRLPSSKPTPQPFIDFALFRNSTIKPHNEENTNKSTPSNPNSWSFLEALSNVTKEASQNETTYVHPQQKPSSLFLSPKSLEICTENLGNESGTDTLSSENRNSEIREQRQQPRQVSTAKKAKPQNFPPPLTTIRGSESLRMRPHRENGRLVIEVTKVPPTPSCFQAQRSHGRLRLCFLTNHTPSFDPEQEEEEEDDDVIENEPLPSENEISGRIKDTEEEEKEECVACGCESDVIMDNYKRPRRCKEGGYHGTMNCC